MHIQLFFEERLHIVFFFAEYQSHPVISGGGGETLDPPLTTACDRAVNWKWLINIMTTKPQFLITKKLHDKYFFQFNIILLLV